VGTSTDFAFYSVVAVLGAGVSCLEWRLTGGGGGSVVLVGRAAVYAALLVAVAATAMAVARRTRRRAAHEMAEPIDDAAASRDELQHRLHTSEERLALALWGADLALWDWHLDTDKVFLSECWARSLGYSSEETPTTMASVYALLHPDDAEKAHEAFADHERGESPHYESSHRVRTPSGEWRWVLDRGKITARDETGRAIRATGTSRDIHPEVERAERSSRLEKKLEKTQKEESLSVMASGIAHDFNNLLQGVVGNANLAVLRSDPGSPIHTYLENIEVASLRAADLTRQLLAYAGLATFVVEPVDLSRLLEAMRPLIRASVPRSHCVRFDLARALPAVEVDSTQVRQIVLNLLHNASDALSERGSEITVRTRAVPGDSDRLAACVVPVAQGHERFVVLQVSDDGSGMDEQTVTKMFDPFYTTKFTGRGLGLAATLGLVRGHGGTIGVDSELGAGSTISVYFPSSSLSARLPEDAAVGKKTRPRVDSVLVVDDESPVLEVTKMILEGNDIRALTASSGEEGLALFSENSSEIGVVMLDSTMPFLKGGEAFERLLSIRPDLRIILMSGYEESEALRNIPSDLRASFLQKPFCAAGLLQGVREALRGVSTS